MIDYLGAQVLSFLGGLGIARLDVPESTDSWASSITLSGTPWK